jgi:hypothetical protein
MRLTSVVVEEPNAVKGLLQGLFNPVLQSESMIWLWHRQQSTTGQTLDYWLVQASRDILAEGAEYVARDEVPAYRLEARDECEVEEGQCFDVVAEPPETKSVIKLYVPRNDAEEDECAYFVIEVVNVVIEVNYQTAKLRFAGVVSRRSARAIVVEGVSLYDKLTELGVAQDGDVNGDGLKDSWLLDFEGSTDAVPFTDNPASHEFDTPPACL